MESSPNKKTIWLAWLLVSLFLAYQYVIRVLPSIIMPEIMQKFGVDASDYGQFSGVYYIGYVLAHIPIGIMLDHIGPKKVLPASIILVLIGMAPITYTDNWSLCVIGRILVGIGSSAAVLGCFKIIRHEFPENQFTRMLGLSVTIGILGALNGGKPVNYVNENFGFDYLMHLLTIIGAVIAFLIYIFTPNSDRTIKNNSIKEECKSIFSNVKLIVICSLGGLMVGPLEGFADVWGKQFLETVYKLDKNEAASLPSLIFLGMCFGSTILSYIADKTRAYFAITILSALIMGTAFTLIIYFNMPSMLLAILFSLIGFFCAYQMLVIYEAASLVDEEKVGLATACANMIIMVFGYVFHTSIGNMMDKFWAGEYQDKVKIYPEAAFVNSLSIIPICLFIGAIGFIIIVINNKKSAVKVSLNQG